MKFEDTKEVKNVLEKIHNLILNLATEENNLNKELKRYEDIQQDLLREIELANLNAIERMRVYSQLRKIRKDRRKIKDAISLIETVKGYSRKFIEKGLLSETNQVMKNIDAYQKNLETRVYKPRVLENLKCVEKINELE